MGKDDWLDKLKQTAANVELRIDVTDYAGKMYNQCIYAFKGSSSEKNNRGILFERRKRTGV